MNDEKLKLYPKNNEGNEIFENAILITGNSVGNQILEENVTLYAEGSKKASRNQEIKVPSPTQTKTTNTKNK